MFDKNFFIIICVFSLFGLGISQIAFASAGGGFGGVSGQDSAFGPVNVNSSTAPSPYGNMPGYSTVSRAIALATSFSKTKPGSYNIGAVKTSTGGWIGTFSKISGQGSHSTQSPHPPTYQCSDNIDNDGDGLIDAVDPGCSSTGVYNPADTNETDTLLVCSNYFDDDGDGLIDAVDPGCWTDPTNSSTYDGTITSEVLKPSITVSQSLIRRGDSVTVSWNPHDYGGTLNCTLSNNILNGNPNSSGSYVDPLIRAKRTYTISCDTGVMQSTSSATVTVLPSIQEI